MYFKSVTKDENEKKKISRVQSEQRFLQTRQIPVFK